MSMTITGADGKEYTIEPNADLSGADLRGIDLSGADLSDADLTDIKYNDETIWPEDFEPPVSK